MRLRSLAAATFALLIGSAALAPASASTTTVTASTQPIVAWSQSVTGTLTLLPNYTSAGVTSASNGTIVTASGYVGGIYYQAPSTVAPGTGPGCTSSVPQSGNFVNYGGVSLPIGSNYVNCDYQNALLVKVVTNDTSGFSVTQQLQLAPGTGFTLCALNEQGYVTQTLPLTTSAVTSTSTQITETTCAGNFGGFTQEALGSNNNSPGVNTLIPYPNHLGIYSGTFYQGEDVLLSVNGSANVATTTYSVTMNVTLTLN